MHNSKLGDDLRPRALRNARGIADMVAMAMGDQDVGGAVARLLDIALESGIAGEEGVDQDVVLAEFQAKGRMAVPGDLHGSLILLV